jgi:hypothetical protein
LRFAGRPETVTYCHCNDCRRWTGAPVAAFAAFSPSDMTASPPLGSGTSHAPGVQRWNCQQCGSPLAARFDYLPAQVYVPLGVIDQADELPPQVHCHVDSAYPWLHITDDLDRFGASGRNRLNNSD